MVPLTLEGTQCVPGSANTVTVTLGSTAVDYHFHDLRFGPFWNHQAAVWICRQIEATALQLACGADQLREMLRCCVQRLQDAGLVHKKADGTIKLIKSCHAVMLLLFTAPNHWLGCGNVQDEVCCVLRSAAAWIRTKKVLLLNDDGFETADRSHRDCNVSLVIGDQRTGSWYLYPRYPNICRDTGPPETLAAGIENLANHRNEYFPCIIFKTKSMGTERIYGPILDPF